MRLSSVNDIQPRAFLVISITLILITLLYPLYLKHTYINISWGLSLVSLIYTGTGIQKGEEKRKKKNRIILDIFWQICLLTHPHELDCWKWQINYSLLLRPEMNREKHK